MGGEVPTESENRASGRSQATPTRSRGWALLFARVVAWLVVPVYVAGMSVTAWLERRIGLGGEAPVEDVSLSVGFGMFAVVGALLVAKRPGNPIGWIMSAATLIAVVVALETYTAYVMITSGQPDALAVIGAWANSWYWFALVALVFIYLPLLFPDGRLPSRRWLPFAVLPGIGVAGIIVLGGLTETLRGQNVDYRIENPIGIEGLAHVEDLPAFDVLGLGLLGIGTVGAVASVVVRFHRSRGTERQQLKWFLYAAAPIPYFPLSDYGPLILDALAFGWVLLGLPAAIGIAVLRYRLYDIDVVINRTLVYGALTITLASIYLGGVVVLQSLFRAVTGQESELAVVASTLVIAALFNPLRRRVQSFVDRRFYRKKYDAAKILAAFGAKLRDETDLDALSDELILVVRETVQPRHVSLWLRPAHMAESPDRVREIRR
jgi:hypothetical protein